MRKSVLGSKNKTQLIFFKIFFVALLTGCGLLSFAPAANAAYGDRYVSTTNFASTGEYPFGIVVDSAGNVYIANVYDSTVTKITPSGESSSFLTGSDPYYLTIDSTGNVYTANYDDSTVTKITPAGVVVTNWAATDASPYPITIDAAGNIYTGNYSSNTISKITPDGISTNIGTTGLYANAIVVDSAGNIFTSNLLENDGPWNITKTTPGGASSVFVSTGANIVEALKIDSGGNLYGIYNADNNITKISPEGNSTIISLLDDTYYGQMVIDSEGNIFVTDYYNHNVRKISPDGTSTVIGETGFNPFGIAIDSAGNIYTANAGSETVTKFTLVRETAPALRKSSNLGFDQSQFGSDTLSDPDGQLRKTIDLINARYGNLIK